MLLVYNHSASLPRSTKLHLVRAEHGEKVMLAVCELTTTLQSKAAICSKYCKAAVVVG